MSKANKLSDYFEIVGSINAKLAFFDEAIDRPKLSGKTSKMFLRHDIDHCIDIAVKFAEKEAEKDIFSTYYLLHTSSYFDYSNHFSRQCKRLLKLGHKIGFHNDLITYYRKTGQSPRDEAYRSLSFLRDLGAEVSGTSSHGAHQCYRRRNPFYNYEIWKEFDPKKNEGKCTFDVPKLSLSEFDLKYETYFIEGFTRYISDTGRGEWRGYNPSLHYPRPFERTLLNSSFNKGLDILSEAGSAEFYQVLTHPVSWDLEA